MTAFRLLLAAMIAALYGYTLVVMSNHGLGLLPIFFGDIAAMTWPGQFNLDFLGFLILSGLWIAWRQGFTPAALGLGLVFIVGGMSVLAPWLLWQSFRTGGDIRRIFLGDRRAAG